MIPNITPRTLILPAAVEIPEISASISPAAMKGFRHLPGSTVKGSILTYGDINAYAWYLGGGWYTANSRRGNRRGARGIEDGRNWQQ